LTFLLEAKIFSTYPEETASANQSEQEIFTSKRPFAQIKKMGSSNCRKDVGDLNFTALEHQDF
jgi:hypothetical protein